MIRDSIGVYGDYSKYRHCVFYDMGHGGLHPVTGNNMTPASNGKLFRHTGFNEFHRGTDVIYEGEKNREYGYEVVKLLLDRGINVVVVSHVFNDTPLQVRTDVANMYHNNIQRGIFISEHSNAVVNRSESPGGNARGISLWTSIGQTTSDRLATMYHGMLRDNLSELSKYGLSESELRGVRLMEDMKDGDPDYEANFHVLVRTAMPAILVENLFFDNLSDARLLMNKGYRDWYVKVQADFIERAIVSLDSVNLA